MGNLIQPERKPPLLLLTSGNASCRLRRQLPDCERNAASFTDGDKLSEAASVGKVTGLTSKTLSNSEIKLSWKKVSGASG